MLQWTLIAVTLAMVVRGETIVSNPDGATLSFFGNTFAIANDRLLVGWKKGGGGIEPGAVVSFSWDGSSWGTSDQVFFPSGLASDDLFGYSVDMDGDYALIGCPGHTSSLTDTGTMFIYKWGGSDWQTDGERFPTDLNLGEDFGEAVAISPGHIVGSTVLGGDGASYDNNGAVYSYGWDTTSFSTSYQKITSPSPSGSDKFGYSLQLIGTDDLLLISSPVLRTLYTYTWSGSAWTLDNTYGTIGPLGSYCGSSLDFDTNTNKLAVGCVGQSSSFAGMTVVLTRSGDTWVDEIAITPSASHVNDDFGSAVAIIDGMIAVGAPADDVDDNFGSVYTYVWDGSGWSGESQYRASDIVSGTGKFGSAVAFHDGHLVASAPNTDSARGKLYYYAITTAPSTSPTTAPTGSPSASPSTSPTSAPTTAPTVSPTAAPTADPGIVIAIANVEFFVSNDTERAAVIDDFLTQVDVDFPPNENYTITKTIKSTETGTLTLELINSVGNNTKLEQAFKELRCGSFPDSCQVTISYGGARRVLGDNARELLTNVVIEITFEVSQALFEALDGIALEDSAFEDALATALDVTNDEDVTITSAGGVITVDATLVAEPVDDPLDTTLVDAANTLQDEMAVIIAALIDVLGSPGDGYVTGTSIDLCPVERDCTNRGTCNVDTGVCACDGDFWGINCETDCICLNEGACVNAYCHCPFPWYGFKCSEAKVCAC